MFHLKKWTLNSLKLIFNFWNDPNLKKTSYFSSDRFTPARFWIGWDPNSVHRIPRISDGQIPGDPHWLRMEKHQPVPGDPLCCSSPWREAFQPPWALCRGRVLERHGGSVRNAPVTCRRARGDGSCCSDNSSIHVFSCKATYRVQINTGLRFD